MPRDNLPLHATVEREEKHMKVQRHGEAATLQVRLNGKDAEDAFFVIVKALRVENKLRKRDGYAPIIYEVETKEE